MFRVAHYIDIIIAFTHSFVPLATRVPLPSPPTNIPSTVLYSSDLSKNMPVVILIADRLWHVFLVVSLSRWLVDLRVQFGTAAAFKLWDITTADQLL